MTADWTPTVRTDFGRVTKARIGEAMSQDAADGIGGLKKPDMAQAAEQRVVATGGLPPLLRTDPGALEAGEPALAHAAD